MKKKVLIVLCCVALLGVSLGTIIGCSSKKDAPPEPLAPIIAEFEEKRAEEIASFKEKKPGYIVEADARAGYVRVIFMFQPGSDPDTAPKNFAKKYDLKKKFPKAEIDDGYSIVTLEFKRDDYTKAVHDALIKLSKEATSVYPIHPHVYAASSIKYKPDISLYAKNPTKLEYTVLDKNALRKYILYDDEFINVDRILLTKEDYDTYIDMLIASRKSEEPPEVLETLNNSLKDKYNEEFFETNALLVTKQITDATSVDNVYFSEDNKIYVVIRKSEMGNGGYMTIPERSENTFHVAVSKDAINGATELITLD